MNIGDKFKRAYLTRLVLDVADEITIDSTNGVRVNSLLEQTHETSIENKYVSLFCVCVSFYNSYYIRSYLTKLLY